MNGISRAIPVFSLIIALVLCVPRYGHSLTAPSAFSGTALSTSSIRWIWTDNSADETSFRVETSTGGAISPALAADTTTYDEGGLPSNTQTTRRATTFDVGGSSLSSAAGSIYTLAAPPVSLTTISRSSFSITLSWSSQDTGKPTTRFTVERATDGGGTPGVFSEIVSIAQNLTIAQYENVGLASLTTFFYRVRVFNGDVIPSAYSTVISTRTKGPPVAPPSNLTGVSTTDRTVKLSWTQPADSNLKGFLIQRAEGSGSFSPLVTLAAAATGYTDTNFSQTALSLSSFRYKVASTNQDAEAGTFTAEFTIQPVVEAKFLDVDADGAAEKYDFSNGIFTDGVGTVASKLVSSLTLSPTIALLLDTSGDSIPERAWFPQLGFANNITFADADADGGQDALLDIDNDGVVDRAIVGGATRAFGTLNVSVTETVTGGPIAGALVSATMNGEAKTALTGTSGKASISFSPLGSSPNVVIALSKSGFVDQTRTITPSPFSDTNVFYALPSGAPATSVNIHSYPNPGTRGGKITIAFGLVAQGRVRIDLFDTSWRRVRSVLDEEKDPGSHSVEIFLRDNSDRELEAGVYFLLIEAGGKKELFKVVNLP